MSRKSNQRDIHPINCAKVESDINILFDVLDKIRLFLEDADMFPQDVHTKMDKLARDARLVQLGLKGIIDFLYDDEANWPLEKDLYAVAV